MKETVLSSLHIGESIQNKLRDVLTSRLASELEVSSPKVSNRAVSILRIAAIAATTELFGNETIDGWFRQNRTQQSELCQAALQVYVKWDGFLKALIDSGEKPDSDELLFFAVIGLLAERPNEVRNLLRQKIVKLAVNEGLQKVDQLPWLDRVRTCISIATLLIIRQENSNDVELAGEVLRKLGTIQKEIEAEWLSTRSDQQNDALRLLSFYHTAQAAIRTSEYLLAGSVSLHGKMVTDFAAELRRLLIRAEEFMQLTDDGEALQWLTALGLSLALLRESSIWVQAKGISERIDKLIEELCRTGRETPVFSLLPSQQDAIRKSLLDPSRVAIILQMPTSAGKTLLAEFSIAQTFDAYRGKTRAAYVVPTRALATQVRRTLTEDLGPLGIKVSAAGSAFEEDPYELSLLEMSDGVVVTTPEKLDLMLRAHQDWFEALRLVIVDEAHLIKDAERGVRLELLLANLRREFPEARLLLLTPFVENGEEVAQWLSRERSHSIQVQWRPSKILLGLASFVQDETERSVSIEWKDPFNGTLAPKTLRLPTSATAAQWKIKRNRVIELGTVFEKLGTVLAIFSASPSDAEQAAYRFASSQKEIGEDDLTPQLRVAIALAEHEYGKDSQLGYCLRRRTSFHHASLSPILRYLIEDQVRARQLHFICATSTLAQGMNFPVATVVVHSIHKPRGGGNFSCAEFWNIAGRAGRTGMAEKGIVLFVDEEHRQIMRQYSQTLTESLRSALLAILEKLSPGIGIEQQYRKYPELRPFIQYLAHAAASSSPYAAIANLEELIQQSLVYKQVSNDSDARKLRAIARSYLQELTESSAFLKLADTSGLGTFSFSELFNKLKKDPVLSAGPKEILSRSTEGMSKLMNVLRWIPELGLGDQYGEGPSDMGAVAEVVQGWIEGKQIHELKDYFNGSDDPAKVRNAAKYIYGKVSQTVSWGAHAYLKSWLLANRDAQLEPEQAMLPAYIQYGVRTPEAAVVSLIGISRHFAEAFGEEYRAEHGPLKTTDVANLKSFIEGADESRWESVIRRSGLKAVAPEDAIAVFRQMQGL